MCFPVSTFLFFDCISSMQRESHVCKCWLNETKSRSWGTANCCLNTAPTLAATHQHQHNCTAPGSHTTWHTDLFCQLVWAFPCCTTATGCLDFIAMLDWMLKQSKKNKRELKWGRKSCLPSWLSGCACGWDDRDRRKVCTVEWGSASC